jgi:hypothetical protein
VNVLGTGSATPVRAAECAARRLYTDRWVRRVCAECVTCCGPALSGRAERNEGDELIIADISVCELGAAHGR